MLLRLLLLRLSVFTAPSHAPVLFCVCFSGRGGRGGISKSSFFSAQSLVRSANAFFLKIPFDLKLKSRAKPKDVTKSPTQTRSSLLLLGENSLLFPSSRVIRQPPCPSKNSIAAPCAQLYHRAFVAWQAGSPRCSIMEIHNGNNKDRVGHTDPPAGRAREKRGRKRRVVKKTSRATDGQMGEEITWSFHGDFPGGFLCGGSPASVYIEGFIPIRFTEAACIIREPVTCQGGIESLRT